jgi:D-arabinose 1-dehydrogenase-like Zn-dependent alcohol dehydrogenase
LSASVVWVKWASRLRKHWDVRIIFTILHASFYFHILTRFPSIAPGHVTAITRSAQKGDFARRCGADTVLLSTNATDMAAATSARSFQLVINTIPGEHDFNVYSNLLAPGGKHVILGLNSGIAVGMALEALCCGNSRVKV